MQQYPAALPPLLRLQLEVLQLAATQQHLRVTLCRLCNLVEELVPRSRAFVQRLDAGGVLLLECAPSAPAELLEAFRGLRVAPTRGSACAAACHGRPVFCVDAREDDCWRGARELAARFDIRSSWSLPLLGRQREVIGVLTLTTDRPGAPTADEEPILQTAVHLAEIAFDRDLSDRAISEQRKLILSVLDGSEDPIFVKDEERRYLLANKAEARGVREQAADMIGLRDEDLYPETIAAYTRVVDEMVLRTGRGAMYEQEFDNAREGKRHFLVRKSPLRDDHGRVRGVIGIARDVTPLKRAEQRVRQIQKLESLGLLAGGIAHDFNNLLMGILGHAERAAAELEAGSAARRCMEEIERAALRASQLTAQLLAYAGQAETAKQPVALEPIVVEVEELLAGSLTKRAVRSSDFPAELPALWADPTQIRQVVMNLLTNAFEALVDGAGHVRTAAQIVEVADDPRAEPEGVQRLEPGRYVQLEVEDDGVGMAPETLARVFEPFYSTKFTGRGLGLAAVQGIVSGHGGAIWARSELGRGSTFSVLLPATEKAPLPEAPLPLDARRRGTGAVLVVEDEPQVQEVMRRVLAGAGYSVYTAGDGEHACEVLAQHASEIVAVVLDLTTPRLSGPEAHARLRALRPDLPVVVVSGYAEDVALARFAPGDIARFVRKPFRGAQLLAAVDAALRKPQSRPQPQPQPQPGSAGPGP